jgi:ribonucleoside-diphosphate reductase beta chain
VKAAPYLRRIRLAVYNYNNTQRHEGKYPLFLGQQPSLHDSINTTYPQIFKLYKKLKSVDWDEMEIDLQQSRFDFENCPKSQYEVMVKTLAYQWELDSIASRSIGPLLAPFITNSEYWAAVSYVSQNEVLHSLTYSEIGRQCFKNPEVLFAEVERNEVTERGHDFGIVFQELEQLGAKYNLGLIDKNDPYVKEVIAKTVIALYALEGISFMSSFACTFALAQQDLFMGVAKLVQKILCDEVYHTQLDKMVIDILQQDPEWKETFQKLKPWTKEYLDGICERELTWNRYIFSEGRSILGLNVQILDEWVHWSAKPLYVALGIQQDVQPPQSHPIPWLNDWIDIDKHQVAAQEASTNNYVLNSFKDDLGEEVLDF